MALVSSSSPVAFLAASMAYEKPTEMIKSARFKSDATYSNLFQFPLKVHRRQPKGIKIQKITNFTFFDVKKYCSE